VTYTHCTGSVIAHPGGNHLKLSYNISYLTVIELAVFSFSFVRFLQLFSPSGMSPRSSPVT